MTVFALNDARLHIDEVFACADKEGCAIVRNDDGSTYQVIRSAEPSSSPLDVPGIDVDITTAEIIEAIHESRERCNT